MSRELSSSSPEPGKHHIKPIKGSGTDKTTGVEVNLGGTPPRIVRIFDSGQIHTKVGDVSVNHDQTGPVEFGWQGKNFIARTKKEGQNSQLIVGSEGQVVFMHSPGEVPKLPTELLTGEKPYRKSLTKEQEDKLFEGISVEDPASFDKLSLGQTFRNILEKKVVYLKMK